MNKAGTRDKNTSLFITIVCKFNNYSNKQSLSETKTITVR